MSDSAEIGVSVPIEPTGLLAGRRHRREQEREVFLRVAEGLLAIEQRDVGARSARLDGVELLEHDLGLSSHSR